MREEVDYGQEVDGILSIPRAVNLLVVRLQEYRLVVLAGRKVSSPLNLCVKIRILPRRKVRTPLDFKG